MPEPPAHPSIEREVLLAEDDPVSRAYLEEALRGLGLTVHACGDGEAALSLARQRRFDLLVLDCRLPGPGAREILHRLQEDPAAASRDAPTLAVSAEVTPTLQRQLDALGCRAVLRKPLRLDELERAVGRLLDTSAATLVDDAAGLQASGNHENLATLRALFAGELDSLAQDLPRLLDDARRLRERLHRLQSSCSFCGATALGEACAALGRALEAGPASRGPALARFQALMADTRAALPDAIRS